MLTLRSPRVSRTLGNIAKACPILTAFLCSAAGLYLFVEPPQEITEGSGVKAAGIFRAALLLLLWRVKVYPRSLKKLSRFMQYIVEFLFAMYIIEFVQKEFWVPLEASIKKLLKKTSEFADENLRSLEMEQLTEYVDLLANEWTSCFVVYGVSVFFFISVLHATKYIDLRDMKYGPEPFMYAIMHVYQKFQELTQSNQNAMILGKKGCTDCQYKIKGGNADRGGGGGRGNNNRSIGWKDEDDQKAIEWKKKNDQKAIEWKKKNDQKAIGWHRGGKYSLPNDDDDYSDFEMDFN